MRIETMFERDAMRTCKFALAALLLSAAGAGSARVPVILLMLAGQGGSQAGAALPLARSDVLQLAAGPEPRRQSAGSFAAGAANVLPVLDGTALMPLSARTRYGALVAARPLPGSGAVLLLLLGCLVYLGRGRHDGFSLRPARNLFERNADAPARR
jgi:hypothetical protein